MWIKKIFHVFVACVNYLTFSFSKKTCRACFSWAMLRYRAWLVLRFCTEILVKIQACVNIKREYLIKSKMFKRKLLAAFFIINNFWKPAQLIFQIHERVLLSGAQDCCSTKLQSSWFDCLISLLMDCNIDVELQNQLQKVCSCYVYIHWHYSLHP